MKNILVTGCRGQLGSEMQLIAPEYPELKCFFTDVEQLDITKPEAVDAFVDQNSIDCMVNCAAFTAVEKAEDATELCDLLNHRAPGFLARAMARRGGNMIQISTDYVFDGTACKPYRETDKTCPASVYGSTKLAGEEAVLTACPDSMIIRTAWLYSSFGNNFVKTMLRLGREKEQLGVVFDQVGTPTYARDLARVVYVILTKGIVPGIYHFSNEGAISWYDFTKAIHRQSGITSCRVRPLLTDEYPTRAARPHYSVLDKTKIKQVYGIEIPYWEDSLAECLKLLEI